uniref:Uncharacterized protein n=1 Tax=Arundo donax TaxID=35708 RepID=A0A0A8YIT4_ARUDO
MTQQFLVPQNWRNPPSDSIQERF